MRGPRNRGDPADADGLRQGFMKGGQRPGEGYDEGEAGRSHGHGKQSGVPIGEQVGPSVVEGDVVPKRELGFPPLADAEERVHLGGNGREIARPLHRAALQQSFGGGGGAIPGLQGQVMTERQPSRKARA